MQLIAKLIQVLPPETGEGKNGTWKKQSIILETEGKFPKKVCVTVWGDKLNEQILQLGNMLDVSFDVESREFNGRWYTDVKAWKVEAVGTAASVALGMDIAASSPANDELLTFSEPVDDLPF